MQNRVACPDSNYRKAIAEYAGSFFSGFNRLPRWRSVVIAASRMHRRAICDTRKCGEIARHTFSY